MKTAKHIVIVFSPYVS